MRRLAGVLFIVGAITFIVGAITLGFTGFFDAEELNSQIAAIENNRLVWSIGALVMLVGAVTTASGLVVLARHLGQTSSQRSTKIWTQIGVVLAVLGGLAFVISQIAALVLDAETFVNIGDSVGMILFATSSIGTLATTIILGIVLFRRGQKWLGGFLVVVMVLALVTGAFFVPLTNYVPLFIAGLVLALRPEKSSSMLHNTELDAAQAV